MPRNLAVPPHTDYAYEYLYETHFMLPHWNNHPLARKYRHDWRWCRNQFRRAVKRWTGLPLLTDSFLVRAAADWKRIIRRHQINGSDAIFFPNADYYAVRGLFVALASIPPAEWPRLHLRLINVMEHACWFRWDPAVNDIYNDLRSIGTLGQRIFVSGEVSPYARVVAQALSGEVATLDFPMMAGPVPLPLSRPFVVGVVGSGRADKGYYRLAGIIELYNQMAGAKNTLFRIQGIDPLDKDAPPGYAERLKSLPNVELLPRAQTYEQMKEQYARAHVLLLPYDAKVYQLRGSAVLAEAIGCGRLVVASAQTGFAPSIQALGNGLLCETDADFARALASYAAATPEALEKITNAAKKTFAQNFAEAFMRVCRQLQGES